jgi:hypothetical protein
VAPGGASEVAAPIAAAHVAVVDERMAFRVVPGTYTFTVGLSSVGDAGEGQHVDVAIAG